MWYRFLEIWGAVFSGRRMQLSPEAWVSHVKGTEVGSDGIQEVSSCFFSRYISTQVHRSIHSPRWIKSWLKSPMIRHLGESLGRRLKKMHYMLFILVPVVLTSRSQMFGCSVSHGVRNFSCLSATAGSAQGEPYLSRHFRVSSNAVGRTGFIGNSWRYSCYIITAVNLSSYK